MLSKPAALSRFATLAVYRSLHSKYSQPSARNAFVAAWTMMR